MSLRLIAGRDGASARLFDAAGGDDLTARLGVTALTVALAAGQPTTATATLDLARVEIDPETVTWLIRHPATGTLEPLRGLAFADGSKVEFLDDGSVVVDFLNRVLNGAP